MVKIIFNIIIIILYNKGENTTRTLQRHSNEQPARRSNTSWWKHLDRYAPSQISSFACYAPDFVQMQRLHLDNLLAKKRFVRVCYDAGMSASVRNKEKIRRAIQHEYKKKYSIVQIRKLYSKLVSEVFDVSVKHFHEAQLHKYLKREVWQNAASVECLSWQQLYAMVKEKPWMAKFRSKKVFRKYIIRKGLDATYRQLGVNSQIVSQQIQRKRKRDKNLVLRHKKQRTLSE